MLLVKASSFELKFLTKFLAAFALLVDAAELCTIFGCCIVVNGAAVIDCCLL